MVLTSKLALVHFDADENCDSLSAALTVCGYDHDCITYTQWLTADPGRLHQPTLLLLNRCGGSHAAHSGLVESSLPARTLGVFCCGHLHGDDSLLGSCTDFVGWPCHPEELKLRLQRVFGDVDEQQKSIEESRLIEQFVDLNLLGESPVFLQALRLMRKFARCDAPILIEGETGTGKELAARAVHHLNSRRDNAFIPTNCGAIPDELVENELFGHTKGAYTNATDSQPGLVEQARGGTLFLDEVDALSAKAQVALLRFLGDQQFRPLGSRRIEQTDVRIISASNADLTALVRRGRFREDLLFRLNVLKVQLPPLRQRGSDVGLLAEYFVEQFCAQYRQPLRSIHPETMDWMFEHPWSGNVRELENLLHRECLLADGPQIRIPRQALDAGYRTTPPDPRQDFWSGQTFREAKARTVESFEKSYLRWLLTQTGGNISAAARQAGKERSALRKLLLKHGIDKTTFASPPR